MWHGQISGTFDLVQPSVTGPKSSQDYLGTLSLHVSAEPGLEEYCRGSRVLQVCSQACIRQRAWCVYGVLWCVCVHAWDGRGGPSVCPRPSTVSWLGCHPPFF